jgi:hypothetical protein
MYKIYHHSDGKIYVDMGGCYYRVTAINGTLPENGASCTFSSGIFHGRGFSCGTEQYPTKLKGVKN